MLEGLEGYLKKKAAQLGLDRADRLAEIQAYLDNAYPGKCRAVSLNDGVLKISTSSSSVASELRYRHRRALMERYSLSDMRITQ